jgi:hypothetical protein
MRRFHYTNNHRVVDTARIRASPMRAVPSSRLAGAINLDIVGDWKIASPRDPNHKSLV